MANGSLVVNYGISVKEMHWMGAPHTVLAYEKEVPTGSGFVLTGNGVEHKDAATFGQMARPRQEDLE